MKSEKSTSGMEVPYSFSKGSKHDYSNVTIPETYLRKVFFPFVQKCIRETELQNNAIFLDLGGGKGEIARIASIYGFKSITLDFCADGLEYEAQLNPAAKGVRASAIELPFADESVMVIQAKDMLVHIKEPLNFFSECERVLKPGGRLLILTSTGTNKDPDYALHDLFTIFDQIEECGLEIDNISSWRATIAEFTIDWYTENTDYYGRAVPLRRTVIEIRKPFISSL